MEERIWHHHYEDDIPVSMDYPDTTLYELFRLAVDKNPRRTATVFFGARLTFKQLGAAVDHFAAALASLGVKPGDRVALILPNMPLYPIAHFAALKLGAILVPTNPLYVERELQYQLVSSGAETAIVLDQLYPRLEKVRPYTPVKRVIVAGVQDFLPWVLGFLYRLKNKSTVEGDVTAGVYFFRDLMASRFPAVAAGEQSADETAIFLYTGGTTGISKGAVLTHRNLVCNVIQTSTWIRARKDEEIILCTLPFFHSYGMTTALHLAILCRGTMVLLPRFELKEVLKRIRKHKPTIFCGVPSMYNAINHSPEVRSEDVNSIRICVSGGAALPAEVQESFESLTGARLVEGYGLSETSPVASVNPVQGRRKTGSIGLPISDTEMKIVDPETHESLPVGEVGELAIKGPQVMKGYWDMPEETRNVLEDGWLYTGDLGRMDEEGFFFIVDRKKDIIVSAGFNVYPREIEEVLSQHQKIMEVAVLGVSSKVREEVVKAFIVVRPGEKLSKAEVMQYCRDRLSKFKMPKQIEFREELPKSSVGKILKRVLKAEEEKGRSK